MSFPAEPPCDAAPEVLDRWLAALAAELIAGLEAGVAAETLLPDASPGLWRQLLADRALPELWELWGQSRNIDENTAETIVEEELMEGLAAVVGHAIPGPTEHAGLQHSYGYLLSVAETPYGFKRARWVEPDIERGLGLSGPFLRPLPVAGTLLANLSWFLGRLVLRDAAQLRRLAALEDHIAPGLRGYDFERLRGVRMVEEAPLRDGALRIFTDLVRYPVPPQAGPEQLLVYSIAEPGGPTRLITAFPVAPGFAAALPAGLGPDRPVCTRYNAWLPAVRQRVLKGRRWLQEACAPSEL